MGSRKGDWGVNLEPIDGEPRPVGLSAFLDKLAMVGLEGLAVLVQAGEERTELLNVAHSHVVQHRGEGAHAGDVGVPEKHHVGVGAGHRLALPYAVQHLEVGREAADPRSGVKGAGLRLQEVGLGLRAWEFKNGVKDAGMVVKERGGGGSGLGWGG